MLAIHVRIRMIANIFWKQKRSEGSLKLSVLVCAVAVVQQRGSLHDARDLQSGLSVELFRAVYLCRTPNVRRTRLGLSVQECYSMSCSAHCVT